MLYDSSPLVVDVELGNHLVGKLYIVQLLRIFARSILSVGPASAFVIIQYPLAFPMWDTILSLLFHRRRNL